MSNEKLKEVLGESTPEEFRKHAEQVMHVGKTVKESEHVDIYHLLFMSTAQEIYGDYMKAIPTKKPQYLSFFVNVTINYKSLYDYYHSMFDTVKAAIEHIFINYIDKSKIQGFYEKLLVSYAIGSEKDAKEVLGGDGTDH